MVGSPCCSRTVKSLLQHHSSKASILRHSGFFIVQLSHTYMTTGKTIAMSRIEFELDLLAVQGTLKSLLQYHSSKASILLYSAFFAVQISHPYMTKGTFVGKVMSLLLNMLSRLIINFLPRSKHLLIS